MKSIHLIPSWNSHRNIFSPGGFACGPHHDFVKWSIRLLVKWWIGLMVDWSNGQVVHQSTSPLVNQSTSQPKDRFPLFGSAIYSDLIKIRLMIGSERVKLRQRLPQDPKGKVSERNQGRKSQKNEKNRLIWVVYTSVKFTFRIGSYNLWDKRGGLNILWPMKSYFLCEAHIFKSYFRFLEPF